MRLVEFVNVYTDGSCINQGKKNAKAAFAVFFGDDDPRNYSQKLSNNYLQDSMLAELEALRHALYVISKVVNNPKRNNKMYSFTIYSDCVNAINWILGSNTPNHSIEQSLKVSRMYYSQVTSKASISFSYVKAHSGVYGNTKADQMAYRACYI